MIRCLSIDDSTLALDLIDDYAGKLKYLQLVKRCQSAVEALTLLRSGNIDLIFLDIQMPDISGIDLLKSVPKRPKIIFTTSYPEYAIEGFEYDAVDYLLKPFSFERFKKASEKAQRQLNLESASDTKRNFLYIKSGYDIIKVDICDILYIEAQRDYIQICTKEKKILTLVNMKDILDQLPSENFIRTHRSFIIALDKISSVSGKKIFVNNVGVPVGKLYRKEFLERLKRRKIIQLIF